MRSNRPFPLSRAVALVAAGLLGGAGVDRFPPAAVAASPGWLTEASLSWQEGYDNNVFLSGVSVPSVVPAPPGSVTAAKNHASWVTTVSSRFSVDLAPVIADTNRLSRLTLAYAPGFTVYHEASSETHGTHRVLAAGRFTLAPVTVDADSSFLYVDGSDMGPFYPGGLASAFASTADRDRRRQIQERADLNLRWDHDSWFVRTAATLLDYNLMTTLLDVPGYVNYADRADVNGGGDLGYELLPQTALTLGYRYGHQSQQQFTFSPYSAPNHYQRLLVGVEGKPWDWLEVRAVAGPDFRSYAGDSPGHVTPLDNLHPVKYYGEASVTAAWDTRDELAFNYKAWQWVSGVGRLPYYETTCQLAYHRALTDKLGFNLQGGFVSWDFSGGNLPISRRQDLQYTLGTGLCYTLAPHWEFTLDYTWNCGQNAEAGIPDPSSREFSQQLVFLAARWKF